MTRDQQAVVLNALDVAKTQWYHFTAIVIAEMRFFTDAYDIFSISFITKILGCVYYTEQGAEKLGTLPPNVSAAVSSVALCGTLAGQLCFGWLGDKLGQKKVYGYNFHANGDQLHCLRALFWIHTKWCDGNALFLSILAWFRHWR
ncbi:putative inorganic phosphate transporter 1-5 [Prunus yedoensis var. nudiflora]|uniref:Putative inorganic phosphate transporter 1-5 n=1 Tax=Prunus yedoensis var. nudiflora TaxID=2094558 RepID=A0A314U908_PRUYE|nr:putative inorganic phosphate transporter 1-5 [Prunus yedoensis var. nudiflora]